MRTTIQNKKLLSAPLAALVLIGLAAPATAAPPLPEYGHTKFHWRTYKCVNTANGYRTIGTVRTEVRHLDEPTKRHYQEVKIQVDRLAGYGQASAKWRKVDARDWDWSRFTGRDLTTYSTSSIRTGMQPDTATLSVKATITLRRVRRGPDKKVWRYPVRSPSFTCFQPSEA